MAIHTLVDGNGFRGGTAFGIDSEGSSGGFTVDTAAGHGITNAFGGSGKQGSDPFIVSMENGTVNTWFMSKVVSNPSTGWVIMGFYFYFESLGGSDNDTPFFAAAHDNSDPHWQLRYDQGGNLSLYDGANSLVDTATSAIVIKKWYRVLAKFQFGSSSTFKLWFGEEDGSHALTFDESTMDTNGTGTDVSMLFDNEGSVIANSTSYYANYFLMTDNGAAWDTNDLTGTISNTLFMGDPADDATAGDWTFLGPYTAGITTDTPDLGNILDVGTWDDLQIVAAECGYQIPGGDEEGTVWSDGTTGKEGPKNDSDVDGEIVGAVWIGRGRQTSGGGIRPAPLMIFGKYDGTTTTTSTTARFTGTSDTNKVVVEGGATDVQVPDGDDYFAYGIFGDAGSFTGGVRMSYLECTILHAETPPAATGTIAIMDGFVQEVP